AATALGYDWACIKHDTRAIWDRLHQLQPADLDALPTTPADTAESTWAFAHAACPTDYPGVSDLLRFKADSVCAVAAELRQTLNEAGASGVALGLNGFAPPWSLV